MINLFIGYVSLGLFFFQRTSLSLSVSLSLSLSLSLSPPPLSLSSLSSPVQAASCSHGSRLRPPWLSQARRPLQAAAGAAGEPAEGEGGGTAEGERQGGGGEGEGEGEPARRGISHQSADNELWNILFSSLLFEPVLLCCSTLIYYFSTLL